MKTALQQKIRALTKAHRGKARALTLLRGAWVFVATALLLIYLDVAFQFPDGLRLGLDFAAVAGVIAVAVFTFRYLTRAASVEKMVARLLEAGHPELENDLVNALEFSEELQRKETAVSKELMSAEIARAAEKLKSVKGLEALRPPTLKKEGLLAAGLAAVAVAFLVFLGPIASAVLPRFLDPFGDHPPYNPTRLTVTPAATVDYGENLKIEARAEGPKPPQVALVLSKLNGERVATLPMFEGSETQFFQTIENVQEDLVYHVEIPRGRSKRQKLSVTKWPRIQTVMVTYDYPAYTKLERQTRLLKEPALKAYKGTKATLAVISNRPLRGGVLRNGADEWKFSAISSNSVAATMILTEPGTFTGSIVDTEGNASRDKLEGPIEIEPDQKPEVAIVSPGMDSFATADAKISINIEAKDDLGVARLELFQGFGGRDLAKKTIPIEPGTMVNAIHEIDLAKLGAKPGDVIEYYATAVDSLPDAPQSASTQPFKLAIITQEQFRELMQSQTTMEELAHKYNEMLRKMEELAAAQEKLRKETAELEQKIASGAATADDKVRLDDLKAQQEKLAEKTREMAKELREEAKAPGTFDIEKDYKKLLEEFAAAMDAAGQEMTQGAGQMGEGGKKLAQAGEHQKNAADKLRNATQQFANSIQQANNDLARIAKLLEDVERFKELLARQEAVETQARQFREMKNPSFDDTVRMKELGEEEKRIEEEMADLAKNLNEHASEAQKDYPKVADDARNIASQIAEKKIPELMGEAASGLGAANGMQGYPPALKALDEMKSLVSQCNSTGGEASGQCEQRLKISMNMNPGQTLQQLRRGMGRGNGQGQGSGSGMGFGGMSMAGAGNSGGSSATPFGLFGPQGMKQRPTSSGGGRSDKKADSLPEAPEKIATSFEEITGARKADLDLAGAGGERVMQEYRALIEAYFRKLAEEK